LSIHYKHHVANPYSWNNGLSQVAFLFLAFFFG
jgi:hypothetical protein